MSQLFIGPSCLGDAVIATGLIDRMLRDYPDEPITIACGPVAALVLEMAPRLEALHVMRKRGLTDHWLDLWRAVAGRRWRRVVDMRRSALPWVLRADARHIVPRPRPGEHRVDLAARTLGLPPQPPVVWLDASLREAAARLLPPGGPVLALGTGANWLPKTWPIGSFAELARRMVAPGGLLAGGRVLLVGTASERAEARAVMQAVPADSLVDAFDLGIPMTAALIERSTLFVGNDSGLMHLAAATRTRTVGLFGPTPDDSYAPWGPNGLVVRTPEPMALLLDRVRAEGEGRTRMDGLPPDAVLDAIARRWPGLAQWPQPVPPSLASV